jgi:hypothetical protein
MSTQQMFFATWGLMTTLFIAGIGFLKYYIDAKIDPMNAQLMMLIDFMVQHEGKIAVLQEKTKSAGHN